TCVRSRPGNSYGEYQHRRVVTFGSRAERSFSRRDWLRHRWSISRFRTMAVATATLLSTCADAEASVRQCEAARDLPGRATLEPVAVASMARYRDGAPAS